MADLFLIQLDKQQEWYHFHHLFRDALHQKLSGTMPASQTVSYTHLRAHETVLDLVCRLLLEKKNTVYTDLSPTYVIE